MPYAKSRRRTACGFSFIIRALVLWPVIHGPILRVRIIRGKSGKDRLIVRYLVIHVFCSCFCFFHTFRGFRSLLQDNGVSCPQIFLGFFRKAQPAIRLNILDGCPAALQAFDTLHPVDGFLIEYPAIAAVPFTGQQALIRVEPQGVLLQRSCLPTRTVTSPCLPAMQRMCTPTPTALRQSTAMRKILKN